MRRHTFWKEWISEFDVIQKAYVAHCNAPEPVKVKPDADNVFITIEEKRAQEAAQSQSASSGSGDGASTQPLLAIEEQ